MMKANNQLGFININEDSIDKIIKDDEVIFERGFLREKTSTTLPITFGGVGKNLKDYKIYGNTYQNSTSGKNLLDISKIDKTTKNGVTCSYDPETQVVTLNGTCTVNNTSFSIAPRPNIPIKTSTTKLYVYCINGSVENYGIFRMYDADWAKNLNINLIDFDANHKIIKKTAGSTFSAVNIGIRLNDGAVCNNFQFKVMVADSDDDTYEPYTNGPAPNPEFPIDMVSCGDRTKNLFDINLSQSISNATKSVDGNNLTITCNGNNQNCYVSYDTSNINLNKTYYFSYTAVADNYAGVMIRAYKNDNTYEVIVDFTQTTKANLNFKVPDNTVYLRTYLYASRSTTGGSIGDKTIYSNVHLGEEPYGYKIPVNVNNAITNIYLDEPLRKIDGYSDYIDFINGKVVRRIKETLLDDSIAWNTKLFANEKRIYTSASNIDSNMRGVTANTQNAYLLSNQYKSETLTDILALSVKYGIGVSSTGYFSILNQDYPTSTEFLQALHDNPITLDYRLRTPTEEDIELPNIPTVEGSNTLNIETEITPSQVYIKYKSNT